MIEHKDFELSSLYNKLLSGSNLDKYALKLLEIYARSNNKYLNSGTSFPVYYSEKTKDIEFSKPLVGEPRILTEIQIPRTFYENNDIQLDNISYIDDFKSILPYIKSEIMESITSYSEFILKNDNIKPEKLLMYKYITSNDLCPDQVVNLLKEYKLSNFFIDFDRKDLSEIIQKYFEYICTMRSQSFKKIDGTLSVFAEYITYDIVNDLITSFMKESDYITDKAKNLVRVFSFVYSNKQCPDNITNLVIDFINSQTIELTNSETKKFVLINDNLKINVFCSSTKTPSNFNIDELHIGATDIFELLTPNKLIEFPNINKLVIYKGDLNSVDYIKDLINNLKAIINNNSDVFSKESNDGTITEIKLTDDIDFQNGYISTTYNVFYLNKKG